MSDALASLRTALAPKTGMRRIPFPLESYQHPSMPLQSKRLLNLFAEQEPDDSRTAAALLSVPDLEQIAAIGPGPVLAMNSDMPEQVYIVSGDHLYRVGWAAGSFSTPEDLGFIGTTDANFMVTIAVGVTACVVCVPPRAYTCGHFGSGVPLNQLGGTFPADGANSVAYLDGYFLFTSTETSSKFFTSRLLDPNDYDALDFAYADAMPNIVDRVVAHRGDAWLIGQSGIEIWYNAGNPDFPFRRRPGGVIDRGCARMQSVALGDGSVFWTGIDNVVYRSVGYQPKRISNHGIEAMIRAQSSFSVVTAFCYSEFGHTFYVVTFAGTQVTPEPTAGLVTVAYDCATGLWHDRSSATEGVRRWRPQCSAKYNDTPILGDAWSNSVWFPSKRAAGIGGREVRSAVLPPLWAGTNRAFCSRLEIELDTPGYLGPILLEWSDDGGYHWTGLRTMNDLAQAEGRRRVFTTRLGSFRQRVFCITAYGMVNLYAVDADIQPGAW
jgi:hypothetical protein